VTLWYDPSVFHPPLSLRGH